MTTADVQGVRDWPELDHDPILDAVDAITDREAVAPFRDAVALAPAAPEADLDLSRAAVLGRRVRLPADAAKMLGLGELAEVCRLSEVPMGNLAEALRGGRGPYVAVALALVLARRLEPDATWEDAQRWTVEVVAPTGPDPTMPRSQP
jgi:hypothetical protein